jgi:hypothetical protein
MEEKDKLPQDKDRHLDVPSEANRDRHFNFLEEDENTEEIGEHDFTKEEIEERQRKWKEGLEEGKKARKNE